MKSILIVSHDIGGANNLAYWAEEMKHRYHFSYYLDGPAINVFSERFNHISILKQQPNLLSYDVVLTGTGWQTDFELNIIRLAKSKGVRCAAYLDHWANFSERFQSVSGLKSYPDEIWVADTQAHIIARNEFSGKVKKIRMVRNRYFRHLKQAFSLLPKPKQLTNLICLEPIRTRVEYDKVYSRIVSKLNGLPVRIRLHPSNAPCGLDVLKSILESNNVDYELSHQPLVSDLRSADQVFGYQSSVLAYALDLNIATYSYYPSKKMEPILPHSNIIYL